MSDFIIMKMPLENLHILTSVTSVLITSTYRLLPDDNNISAVNNDTDFSILVEIVRSKIEFHVIQLSEISVMYNCIFNFLF